MFSYIDLVRGEISLEMEEEFDITITDAERDAWRTLEDVARSVIEHSRGRVNESKVVDWVRTLIREGYGAEEALLTPGAEVFNYDLAITWFSALPYPSRLGDRRFARKDVGWEKRD